MTPAEELHAAADKIRKLATNATPGPWSAQPYVYGPPEEGYGEPENWEVTASETRRDVVSHQPHEGGGAGPSDARYIAAMHPGIGTALADWLEAEGRTEAYTLAEFGHRGGASPHALTIARLIERPA